MRVTDVMPAQVALVTANGICTDAATAFIIKVGDA